MSTGSGKTRPCQTLASNTSKSLLLKDDLSSCSSSGFKSLPRRQCCLLQVQPRSSSCFTKSALQKASDAVLNAVKSLSIPSQRRYNLAKGGGVVSRSFSRRLMSRSFWRKACKSVLFLSTGTRNAWSHSHFSSSLTAAEDSTRECQSEEKEQFSPVSVLDCLSLFDDDEVITSPFNSKSCSLPAKTKQMQNNDIKKSNMKSNICKVAEDWIQGQHKEQYLSLKVREMYIKEMENCGTWIYSDEELQCLAMELEVEFSSSLVNELVLDLIQIIDIGTNVTI